MYMRNNFQFNRSIPNSQAQGQDLTTVLHSYISATDTNFSITEQPYFYDHFGENETYVVPHDIILIWASDAISMNEVLTTAPVTLGPNLFAQSSLIVAPPIAPTDTNGVIVTGDTIKLQFASKVAPGILSTANQEIAGDKYFFGNMTIAPLVGDFSSIVETQGLQIHSVDEMCGVDIFNLTPLSIMNFSFGSINLGPQYAGMQFSAEAFGGDPKLILFNAELPSITIDDAQVADFNVGLTVPTVGGTKTLFNYLERFDFTTTLTNDTTTSEPITFKVIRMLDYVTITLEGQSSIAITSLAPWANFIADTALPERFRPAATPVGVISLRLGGGGGTVKSTSWVVDNLGHIGVYFDSNQADLFPTLLEVRFGPGGSMHYIGV